ncbi:hypothetical protein ASC89_03750 [Devosia sp. Root413D1]|jgi:hypothetical protein|uniref:hypothetical protein n=1 Tax=unclassified Devosia TaxID=196773 RepID=UPI0006FDED4C|nr:MULTISPECIES: hypothetical protein [unclassified Devosia]KQV08992.1 hypothetical protein ASC68_01325 [Devosia sp. Root105]KQW86176.1 hypothetical protein ASC89_03750 [Devosia sp. Root413D1]MDF2981994.1 hypothetical protein [Devosia sp.]RYE49374.1 MAG: hypothetical protein EOP24_02770 [Hyphomicrobiales bacterium]
MQHAHFEKPHSAKPIAVDIDGEPKGVLVAHDAGFRFLAVKLDAFGVDGQVFASIEAAEAAVRDALRPEA